MSDFPFDYWTMDAETYPNCFLTCGIHPSGMRVAFEISDRRNDSKKLIDFFMILKEQGSVVTTFNGIGFDYPIWHMLIKMGDANAKILYDKAMSIIESQDTDKFANMIYPKDRVVRILDLFRMKHYTNRARTTSLKALEFAMKMDNISDLPFPVGTHLNSQQMDMLTEYCFHDVHATELFLHECKDEIQLRLDLVPRLGEDVINANDTKIGAMIFQKELEAAGVELYEYGPFGRKMRQTPREELVLNDAILPWIQLETPGFKRILDWMRQQTITETKGVFEDLTVHEYGLDFVFGTGGIHAAIENETLIARDDMLIESRDVSSYYPNLAIKNKFYPEHLGVKFCEIYEDLYKQRKQHKKGTAMNAALKLSLNGTYGKSGDKYSVFYDPLFLLKIVLNGQLLLCLLAENLVKVPTVRLVMLNTDGLEYTIHPDYVESANKVCDWWQGVTKLELEGARYKKLCILNVNNYVGELL